MKSLGYVICSECDGRYRGYRRKTDAINAPLRPFAHSWEDAHHGFGRNDKCLGSAKPGHGQNLDVEIDAAIERGVIGPTRLDDYANRRILRSRESDGDPR